MNRFIKKILLMFLVSFYLFPNLHPNIPFKYVQVKGKEDTSFLSDMIDINQSEIIFYKNDNEYVMDLEYIFEFDDESSKSQQYIEKFDINTEILSVFFHEISGDSLREIFVISKLNNDYKVHAYGVTYDRWSFYYNDLEPLTKILNETFKEEKNLNASLVKKEVDRILKIPVDIPSFENWSYSEYENIDFLQGEFIGYFDSEGYKVEDFKDSKYYIKKFNDNIYGYFENLEGFQLIEVFEGKEVNEKPYIIREGKSTYYDGYLSTNGTYLNNKKHGEWEESARMYLAYGNFENGVKVGKWWVNGYIGKLENDLKEGLWISEDGDFEELYDKGVLVEEREYEINSEDNTKKLINKRVFKK